MLLLTKNPHKRKSKSKKKRVKRLKILKINSITLLKTTLFSREELK